MRQNPPAQPDAGADAYANGAPEETDAAEAPDPDQDEQDPDDAHAACFGASQAVTGQRRAERRCSVYR